MLVASVHMFTWCKLVAFVDMSTWCTLVALVDMVTWCTLVAFVDMLIWCMGDCEMLFLHDCCHVFYMCFILLS
jgi:hypothetical protein